MFTVITLIILAIAAITGFKRGVLSQLGSIAAVILAIIACRIWGDSLACALSLRIWGESPSHIQAAKASLMTHALLLATIWCGVSLTIRLCHTIVRIVHLGIADRFCGSALMLAKWSLGLSVAINVWFWIAGASPTDYNPWIQAIASVAPHILGMINF